MSKSNRIHLPTLFAVVLLAAIFRGAIAAPDACISRDGVWFVEMAKKLADDPLRHMRIETKQPGLSWVMLAVHSLRGVDTPEDWQTTGVLIAGAGGVAVCALVYFLALRLFDRKVAAVAGVFAAFWPHGAQLSADVLSDMPHLAMYLAAMALLASGLETLALLRWSAAGALLGAAYWFRLEAIGLLPAVGIWALIAATRERWRQALAPLACFFVAFTIVAGPFVVMARMPALTDANVAPAAVVAPSIDDVVPMTTTVHANVVGPSKLPGKMAEEWARSGRYIFAALFLAALFIKSTPRAVRPFAVLCGIAATMQLLLVAARVLKYGELSSRYMLVPIALTIPWSAAAFVHLVGLVILRLSDDSRYKFIPIWASGLMITLFPLIYYGNRPINAGRQALREAGTWLRQSASPEDVILADDQNLAQVQFYADRVYPKAAKWDALARNAGAAAREEAIGRIRPKWFVTMVDSPDAPVDADARAAALAEALPGYVAARVFDDDARPVIVLVRGAE